MKGAPSNETQSVEVEVIDMRYTERDDTAVTSLSLSISKKDSVDDSIDIDPPHMYINTALLSLSFCLGMSGFFLFLSTSTLHMKQIQDTSYSSLPLGFLVVAACISVISLPSFLLRYGFLRIYSLYAFPSLIGAALSLISVSIQNENLAAFLLIVGAAFQGPQYACSNSYRLQVSKIASKRFLPKALSLVVGGGIFAVFLGPECGKLSRGAMDKEFRGSYVLLFFIYLSLFITLFFIRWPSHKESDEERERREETERKTKNLSSSSPEIVCVEINETEGEEEEEEEERVREDENVTSKERERTKKATTCETIHIVLSNRCFVESLLFQTISFCAMGALMVAAPISMKDEGFSSDAATTAISIHMLGMYVPSLFTGNLISIFGPNPVTCGGLLTLVAGAFTFFAGQTRLAYYIGMVLVGIGWNFSFVGGTSLFSRIVYTREEEPVAHMVNDMVVIGLVAITFTSTGALLMVLGWFEFSILWLCIMTFPVCLSILRLFYPLHPSHVLKWRGARR